MVAYDRSGSFTFVREAVEILVFFPLRTSDSWVLPPSFSLFLSFFFPLALSSFGTHSSVVSGLRLTESTGGVFGSQLRFLGSKFYRQTT